MWSNVNLSKNPVEIIYRARHHLLARIYPYRHKQYPKKRPVMQLFPYDRCACQCFFLNFLFPRSSVEQRLFVSPGDVPKG